MSNLFKLRNPKNCQKFTSQERKIIIWMGITVLSHISDTPNCDFSQNSDTFFSLTKMSLFWVGTVLNISILTYSSNENKVLFKNRYYCKLPKINVNFCSFIKFEWWNIFARSLEISLFWIIKVASKKFQIPAAFGLNESFENWK